MSLFTERNTLCTKVLAAKNDVPERAALLSEGAEYLEGFEALYNFLNEKIIDKARLPRMYVADARVVENAFGEKANKPAFRKQLQEYAQAMRKGEFPPEAQHFFTVTGDAYLSAEESSGD